MVSHTKSIYAFGISISLIIAAAAAAVYLLVFRAPVDAASETGRGIFTVIEKVAELSQFKPKIVIGERVVVESRQQIAELAVAEKPFSHTYSWEHTYLSSTKKFVINGDFVAKAGYKLKSPAEIHLPESSNAVRLILPEAVLLSNEVKSYHIVEDDDGYWNKLSGADREGGLNALKKAADAYIVQSGLLRDADESMLGHIREAIQQSVGPSVTLVRESPPVP